MAYSIWVVVKVKQLKDKYVLKMQELDVNKKKNSLQHFC